MKHFRNLNVIVALLLSTAPATADDPTRGKTLFNRCAGCHTVTGQNKVGPHLDGVFGRTAGKVEGARYSNAMSAWNIVWNEERLDAFLTAPRKALPGTTMTVGMPKPQDRSDIIAYLKSVATPNGTGQ
ncbi:cytochrome c family protein [Pararhizobium sp. BT-229]|uniref:c-type cytochrome n=1 Tax=Pararhizobium sp. BT-229 TaxID=2986923 RepID=UPI0021F73917|nr:cytochrome c family protein [Pararhizobium sp. BT-229]MCV9963309.1 cytochrome c family protein [Pararhizobium sp. BT-229]